MNDTRPIKTFRDGPVGASVWLCQTGAGVFYDVTFSRCWKDETTGKFGYSQTFSDYHLQTLIDVVEAARDWIARQKDNAETVTGPDDLQLVVSAEAG